MSQQPILILAIAANAMDLPRRHRLLNQDAAKHVKKSERLMPRYHGHSAKVKVLNNAKGSTTRKSWKLSVTKGVG